MSPARKLKEILHHHCTVAGMKSFLTRMESVWENPILWMLILILFCPQIVLKDLSCFLRNPKSPICLLEG